MGTSANSSWRSRSSSDRPSSSIWERRTSTLHSPWPPSRNGCWRSSASRPRWTSCSISSGRHDSDRVEWPTSSKDEDVNNCSVDCSVGSLARLLTNLVDGSRATPTTSEGSFGGPALAVRNRPSTGVLGVGEVSSGAEDYPTVCPTDRRDLRRQGDGHRRDEPLSVQISATSSFGSTVGSRAAANHVFAVRPNPDCLGSHYLEALLGSRYAKDYYLRTAKQTTNLASTNETTIGRFLVPLPTVEEQGTILRRWNKKWARSGGTWPTCTARWGSSASIGL